MRKETNSFHILNTCSLEIELGRNVDLLADVFAVLFPLAHALGQKILDLAVDGAEIVLCPGGDGGVELGGQAQGTCFLALSFMAVSQKVARRA